MRVLVATDAWRPQVNGVVRTLSSLAASAARTGAEVTFLTPEGFPSLPVPTYPDLHVALPRAAEIARRIEAAAPDAVHVATEGPIGHAARAWCLRHGHPFTTSFMTRFPEYVSARLPFLPESLVYGALRRFHAPARAVMVSTPSLLRELHGRGFERLAIWGRGVDTDLFRPDDPAPLDLPRPIFMTMGRVAVEKNLPAFLGLDLPGSKVVIGDGPQAAELRRRYPDVHFLGARHGAELASHLAAADVFVFPSRTDTYGLVQLEALACGVPVAAFPVTGPRDVVGGSGVAALDEDLRAACLRALAIPRAACRAFALGRSWEASTREFLGHLGRLPTGARPRTSSGTGAEAMAGAVAETVTRDVAA
jgi:glycosyltransferase involved in cell wall biosynthesis